MTPEQKQRANEAKRRYWERNRQKLAEKKNRHYHKYRDKYLQIERERSYKKLYGITIDDYNRMHAQQNGQCAICGTKEPLPGQPDRAFSVDHCHQTGRVRGLLCVACNHLLGRFEKHKQKIFEYLSN